MDQKTLGQQKLTKFDNLLSFICDQVHMVHCYSHRDGSCRADYCGPSWHGPFNSLVLYAVWA